MNRRRRSKRKNVGQRKANNRRPESRRGSLFRWFAAFIWILSIGIGIVIGWSLTTVEGMAERVRELETLRPSLASVVYDMNDKIIHEFAVQKRIPVEAYEEIPERLRTAIIVTEDEYFFRHPGINPVAILRALYRNIRAGRAVQGASTITQQLARMVFLTPEKRLQRKIKEAFLALQIEKLFTKEEIFTYYYNNVYLGHGIYGFEAAARYYFGKPAKLLRVEEAALLAGLIQRPEAYTPYRNPDLAIKRRNYVLKRMYREHVIDKDTYEHARKQPIRIIDHEERSVVAPYFIEEVRKYIERKYGSDALYHGGLKIYTTLDTHAQSIAEQSLKDALYALTRRQGWPGPIYNVLVKVGKVDLATYHLKEWPRRVHIGDEVPVLVTDVSRNTVVYRLGENFTGQFLRKDRALRWLRTSDFRRRFKVGDVILVRLIELDREAGRVRAELLPIPQAEGAFVALDPLTGEIRVMVGGYSFERSKYNRVTQAKRQPGSAFKPIVWLTALKEGYTLSTLIEDAPIELEDPVMKTTWAPGNFDNRFLGLVTLQRALELSRNTVAVRLALQVGLRKVIETAKRLGLDHVEIPPYPSIALGTIEVTPLQMTAVYAVFANGGLRIRPYFIRRIEDRYGRVLESRVPETRESISPELAYIMTTALEGVIRRGTAYAAHDLPFEAAGKTGTTDNFTDTWFIGYTPLITAGVWIGFDEPRRLGKNETGGHTALPAWKSFIESYMSNKPEVHFQPPSNVVIIPVDLDTGLRATPECPRTVLQAYLPGTEPVEYCSRLKHAQIMASRAQYEGLVIPDEDDEHSE